MDRAKRRALFCGGLREKERARNVQVGGEAERFCDNYGKVQGSELYCSSGRMRIDFSFFK